MRSGSKGKKKADKKGKIGGRGGFSVNIEPLFRLFSVKSFYILIFISLAVPNLVFSGPHWFDTLHIMKWFVAMVPIAAICIITGLYLLVYGRRGEVKFEVDTFTLIWLVMLLYITIQPIWANITSKSTFWKEWYFFACLIAAYTFSYNMFKSELVHKIILWCANLNAAINVVFAELLIREIGQSVPFIMWVPGNYIGNTGQQEMFGLWMAVALMNGLYLHVAFGGSGKGWKHEVFRWSNLLLLAVNAWGLWNSTTRGGIFSLLTGTIILGLIVLRTQDKARLKRMSYVALMILVMLAATIVAGKMMDVGRSADLVRKVENMVTNPGYLAGRRGIWTTSATMIKDHWLGGVGIGHYKWNYIYAQQKAIERHNIKWQFTYWAHSEYLQWFAEFGLFGTLLLLAAACWWLWSFTRAVVMKKAISIEASWGCALVFLIWFDALFSRPFHRIENVLWLSFAFALANREILVDPFRGKLAKFMKGIRTSYLLVALVISITGLAFLTTGLIGDQYLWNAHMTNSARLRRYRIKEAMKYPMAKDDALESYAKYCVDYAKVTGRPEDLKTAAEEYYKAFKTQPRAMVLIEAAKAAQQAKDGERFNELYMYLQREKPEKRPDIQR